MTKNLILILIYFNQKQVHCVVFIQIFLGFVHLSLIVCSKFIFWKSNWFYSLYYCAASSLVKEVERWLPEPSWLPKYNELGDDAHFVRAEQQTVADGVGGWEKKGMNTDEYEVSAQGTNWSHDGTQSSFLKYRGQRIFHSLHFDTHWQCKTSSISVLSFFL